LGVREDVFGLAEPVAARRGLTLVEVQWRAGRGRAVLSLVVDKPGGVTLGDLEGLHRELDPLLDAHDPVPGPYVLEVSSPGAERPLRTPRDFQVFAGRRVVIHARAPVSGQQQWTGRLLGVDADCVVLERDDGGTVRLPLAQVARARLWAPR